MRHLNKNQDKKSILIVGSQGMLGREVVEVLQQDSWIQTFGGGEIHACDIDEIDITDPQSIAQGFERFTAELLINCAAYTDVDGCETNRRQAFAVNGDGPGHLARACRAHHSKLIHISTDFVFNGRGDRPYQPEDPPDPISVYGQSKLAGERALQENIQDYIIVRTSWLFGKHGENFVSTICRLGQERPYLEVVDDQVGSPTYAVDLARALLHLAAAGARGIFHFSNEGHCTWYEFAGEIVRQFGLRTEIRPIRSEKLDRPALRPSWSVMDITRYKEATGQSVRRWQDALADYQRQF